MPQKQSEEGKGFNFEKQLDVNKATFDTLINCSKAKEIDPQFSARRDKPPAIQQLFSYKDAFWDKIMNARKEKKAVEFFLENLNFHRENIVSVKRIDLGYSNFICKVVVKQDNKQQSFKLRLGENNHIISRQNECSILSLIEDESFVAYDLQSGNGVQKWIEGDVVQEITKKVIYDMVSLIDPIHKKFMGKKISVIPHNHLENIDQAHQNLPAHVVCNYLSLLRKHKDLPLTLSHNDISAANLIMGPTQLHLIDWEWGRTNTREWDYGNFIRGADLSIDLIHFLSDCVQINIQTLIEFAFIATHFSFQLSFSFADKSQLRIRQYRKKLAALMGKYSDMLLNGWE